MKKGFTLIETIAVLLLVSILAMSVLISMLPMTQGLLQVRENTAAAQKARLAMVRLSREFTTITNIVSFSSGSVTYDFLVPSDSWYTTLTHTLSWDGTPGHPLMLQGVPLTDDVENFTLTYLAGPPPVIEVVLQSQVGESGNAYSNRIAPRNILAGP